MSSFPKVRDNVEDGLFDSKSAWLVCGLVVQVFIVGGVLVARHLRECSNGAVNPFCVEVLLSHVKNREDIRMDIV